MAVLPSIHKFTTGKYAGPLPFGPSGSREKVLSCPDRRCLPLLRWPWSGSDPCPTGGFLDVR